MATTASERRARAYDGEILERSPSWRERLIPRTVLGLSAIILASSIGAAFSGAVLYAYYDYRLNKNEERIAQFTQGFDENFTNAIDTIKAEREQAKADVQKELQPLKEIRAEGDTLKQLMEKVQPSMWFVRSLDEAGQPSVGSAFVIASDNEQTLLLTSYTTVRAATRRPGPDVFVRKGDEEVKATLWTWQEDKDLALLILNRGKQPKLAVAPKDPPVQLGERIFAVSGLGAAGGAITQGFVADVFAGGIQHDAAIGSAFQGGPLLNSKGEVLGIASRSYAPLGFATESVFFGIPLRAACEQVLRCPGGDPATAGNRR